MCYSLMGFHWSAEFRLFLSLVFIVAGLMDWYKVTTKRSDYWRSWGIKSFAELYTKSIKCQLWMITHNISLPQFNSKRRILLYILPTLIQFITSIQWLKSAPFFFCKQRLLRHTARYLRRVANRGLCRRRESTNPGAMHISRTPSL